MWKPNEPNLPNNYSLALSRQHNLERSKHLATEQGQEDYNKVFRSWIQKGYLQRVPEDEIEVEQAFYLPHFPVKREDKTTSKVRPVLDGAAKWKDKSLNDAIYVGPKVINDLDVVLTRFRRRQIALGGDVSEMFLQILMYPEDRQFHRIIFREKATDPLVHYHFVVHPFGNRGSPCVAIYTIKKQAEIMQFELPRASETVLESTLVDDNLDSVSSTEEAIQLIQDLKKIYTACGMKITKFISNSHEVLASVTEEERAKDVDIAGMEAKENLPLVKVLGVVWKGAEDLFTFTAEPPEPTTKWSKRMTLRTTARLFDPLGFLAPYIIRGRMEYQSYWVHKLSWDESLPEEALPKWLAWIKEFPKLSTITVPDVFGPRPTQKRLK